MPKLSAPLTFLHGPEMKNRFMLAPLTNWQSHENGILSDEEYHWLTMRAKGGFGLTMTCAAHVQEIGKGFPGQLGVFSDDHIEGLTRLADGIRKENSLSIVQLHHAGMRSPAEIIGETPVCPSVNEEFGARALSTEETRQLVQDFIEGAVRSERAGFDGVELHGAHGYIICQYLSAETNQREDEYGGSFENRNRILFEIIDGIRQRCSEDFILGVRLSPERFGVQLDETVELARQLFADAKIDFLDMSLWDVFKEPADEAFQGRSLLSYFSELDRGDVRLGVAGKIYKPADADAVMEEDIDWIMLGRAAILHHDFPNRYFENPEFEPIENPVPRSHLVAEGLSGPFVDYMSSWPGFVEKEE